ncbi:MAG: peptide chain release factor-like protein [Candidatus Scalindua sp.]|jgi:protein subunit release factor B|nr:peptide chain release factor-like protein [Candidatus Scalindua sp.]MBT5305654.1 peptide chain release factor-like protein [Candidatus Scalindua sp.]MBT6048865.1 peptide chain release factor-like protein [Candidatus Scalindua sp.]MBT6229876.1 peptide chain release factor-like protein [Candidatus Scalindua sp.]MBT6561492.1 peptide chain release factor-like protein [Candidatus Scalindua sp.]
MSIFNVSEKKEKALLDRMRELNVNENDLEEHFIRSSGPGGQKVNKTSSCVSLRHIPTDITVKYQCERSQALNRFFARRTLLDQIERLQKGFVKEEKKRIDKIKSQKRKKKKRTKEKLSALKPKQSDTNENND